MSQPALTKNLGLYWEAMRRSGQYGLPLRLRLFGFLVLFLNIIMVGVMLILFSTGIFQADLSEHRRAWQVELTHLTQDIDKAFEAISVQTVELAEVLTTNVGRNVLEQGGSVRRLQATPQLLEPLLEAELGGLISALQKSRASGIFLVLDATVNPVLPNAENSKSCVYLKNMEPNIVNQMEANLRYSFGPMSIARNNDIRVLPQWGMELDTSYAPYFAEVMATAKKGDLPTSRLYRWSKATILPNNSERVMLCAAPLIAADGTVFGLCGFEISQMLFKLSYMPPDNGYEQVFSALMPLEHEALQPADALSTKNFTDGAFVDAPMEISYHEKTFNSYRQAEEQGYAGLHQAISLYPHDSAYADEQWVLALMMPQATLDALLSAKNRSLTLGLLAIMVVNIGLAAFISRKYLHPVMAALEQLKQPNTAAKTGIPEIDDLIEFLAARDDLSPPTGGLEPLAMEHSSLYLEFVNNIKKLSAAEKAVFDLYVQGHTAREIAEILCLSINTIKTHNRRIYMKLNVSSRKELMVYIRLMAEAQAQKI